MTAMMKGSKEYELIGEGNKDTAVVLFRFYGAMGYPNLHRRPGKPNGPDYMVFQTLKYQMLKENSFDLALAWYESYDGNRICQDYIQCACPQLCFEGQRFDKSVHPVPYFPTNPPKQRLPDSWSFLNMDELQGCFGSLVREKDYWLLRLYNSEIEPVSCGIIHSDGTPVYMLTILDHTMHKPLSNELEPLRKGELRMIQIGRT